MSAKRKLGEAPVGLRTRRTLALLDALDEPVSKRTRRRATDDEKMQDASKPLERKCVDRNVSNGLRMVERLESISFEGVWRQRSAESRAANPCIEAPSAEELTSAIADTFNSMPTTQEWVPSDVQGIVAEYSVPRLGTTQIHTGKRIQALAHSEQYLFTGCGNWRDPSVVEAYSLKSPLKHVRTIDCKTQFCGDGMVYYSGWLIIGDYTHRALATVDVRSSDPEQWRWEEQKTKIHNATFHAPRVSGVQGDSLFVWLGGPNLQHMLQMTIGIKDDKIQLLPKQTFSGGYCSKAVAEPGTIIHSHSSYTSNGEFTKDYIKITKNYTTVTNIVALPQWSHVFGYTAGKLFAVFEEREPRRVSIIDPDIGGEITSVRISNTSSIVALDIIDDQFLVAAHECGLLTITPLPLFKTPTNQQTTTNQ